MGLRVMVYSHDTFGLGNIRRMLALSEHLVGSVPGASVLLVTGSPMVQSFRIAPGLDYIKLPCLSRVGRDQYSAKSLGTEIGQLMQLRAGLIQAAAKDFEPDIVLVDKKPEGVKHELRPTLEFLRRSRPQCKVALVLRDILDAPEPTIASWREQNVEGAVKKYFDSVLILGDAEVFDAPREYRFPTTLRQKVRFCGYLRRASPDAGEVAQLRTRLLGPANRLAVVTPGGGEDGFQVADAYMNGMATARDVASAIVCGPEMPAQQQADLRQRAAGNPRMTVMEFSGEMTHMLAAADVVVSMAGYNTICEILSLGKPAVTVPRARPVQEQWIRASRLERMGLLSAIHPDALTAEGLAGQVMGQLNGSTPPPAFPADVNGLETVLQWVLSCAPKKKHSATLRRLGWQASLTY